MERDVPARSDPASPGNGWLRRRRRRQAAEKKYWDFFINTPAADPRNEFSGFMREAPEGSVNSVMTDVHTPEIMTSHIRQIAQRLGSDLMGVVTCDPGRDGSRPFPDQTNAAIVCVVPSPHDPGKSPGVGGQAPVRTGIMISFILAAYIRECGYVATVRAGERGEREALAVRAGLGSLDRHNRLRTTRYGTRAWVADVVYTNLPLAGRI